ncbi:uncharacterized protein LOC120256197 [Dioscorea cayenensis subsp. rotundata]|uniref:Uncharacterized protein LOC120256197 n=1 Tax=Dioscorea cayennensis subsp. rotundata TaxID=55577 RepID=A0AB40AY06_DIOCR|nr:uncharacterized protein LOC120256197 [Dioscorea cayenensis subsp. rotundata]
MDDMQGSDSDLVETEVQLIEDSSNGGSSSEGKTEALGNIPIALEDQEKTTFNYPYGTFAYHRIPFGLCNALVTFQRFKAIRSFLGHAGFYRRFVKNFSVIARPLTKLLEKGAPFEFSEDCMNAFLSLKKKLFEAPLIVSPDWSSPFEVMCDMSDYTIGAVLGKQWDNISIRFTMQARL